MAADYDIERMLMGEGFLLVAGIDEAGRGPLAGPVSAAAVVLNPDDIPEGIADSKTLSAAKRERIFEEITARAVGVSVALVPPQEIDATNIRLATHAAMRRALASLSVTANYALVDGNDLPSALACPARTIVKGDAKSLSIAAASIIAKVTRDRVMEKLHALHPEYGFARHSGYGTAEHMAALKQQVSQGS